MNGFRVARLAAAVGFVLTGMAAQGVSAEEEGVLMKELLGAIGVLPNQGPPIDYRERAPLVVPPQLDLRPPVDSAGLNAAAPNWPKDPDVEARRRREAEDRLPRTETDVYKRSNSHGRLSIDEIRAGRIPGRAIPQEPQVRSSEGERDGHFVQSGKSHGRSSGAQNGSVVAGAEPERRSLTEPPAGLRAPAGGMPVKPNYDPPQRSDESSPWSFIRQQSRP